MKVYIDVLLLENFLVNLFLMYVTSETMSVPPKLKKMIFPSIIAASYTLVVFLKNARFLNSIFCKIGIVVVFLYLYFKIKDWRFIIKSSIIYVMYSMILAGLCIFIDMELNSKFSVELNVINFSYKRIMLSIMFIYILLKRILCYIKDRQILKKLIYKVELEGEGWSKTFNAFLDTGNELREPATNLPVLVIEESVVNDVPLDKENCFYIPYAVVDGQGGNMVGYKIKSIKIYFDEKNVKETQGIICICKNKLSIGNEYSGLLSRGLI